MRILFLHPFAPQATPEGRLARAWATALESAGHEARLILVEARRGVDPLVVDTIVCHPSDEGADLRFSPPEFTALAPPGSQTFAGLTDGQLTEYREALRRRLDAQIDRFNPDILHAQYVWVTGQLALETGVPFVVSAWGPELDEYQRDSRYQPLAEQAAENAGCILAGDEATARQVEQLFEGSTERIRILPPALRIADPVDAESSRQAAALLTEIYKAVLDQRFGP